MTEAQRVFAGAHGLSVGVGLLTVAAFSVAGYPLIVIAAEGSEDALPDMAYTYMAITVCTSPLLFVLSIQSDALRCEGFVMQMAGVSLFVSLLNIALNFVFVVVMHYGVAGTAAGTALAQLLSLLVITGFRLRADSHLKPPGSFQDLLDILLAVDFRARSSAKPQLRRHRNRICGNIRGAAAGGIERI